MKTLNLSCNNGGGHNAVAAAIKELYIIHGQSADIVDVMSFLPKGWSKTVSDIHTFAYCNTPELFRHGYELSEIHREEFDRGHIARSLLDLGTARLCKYIKNNHYDRVICSHVFAGIMLSDAVKKYNLDIVSGIVETDYTVSPGAEKNDLNWHFVPSEKQAAELAEYGISRDNIVVSGIPIRNQFDISIPKEEAREQLGIKKDGKNITVVCGSMGCGHMSEILEELIEKQALDSSVSISVVCGSNKKLYKRLSMRYGRREGIYIFGKIQNMSLLLDSADVYVTKPGGISTTEAARKQIPMVLINAVGGCEKHNMDFFTQAGGAVTSDNHEKLANQAFEICHDETLAVNMSRALKGLFAENKRENIYNFMLSGRKTE